VKYISLFSGIGGLESEFADPMLCCELDGDARTVLHRKFPNAELHDDIMTLSPPSADVLVGGWPCQDLSIAGKQEGLEKGARSSLFFELLRVAEESSTHSLILENVPNLLTLNKGEDFRLVLHSLVEAGFEHCSWRLINSLELGVPQDRERVFIVASKHREISQAIHRTIIPFHTNMDNRAPSDVLGFYWTASARSLCIRRNIVPTLKVGAPSHKGGISPVAVCYNGMVRKLTVNENLRFQGFSDFDDFVDLNRGSVLRMAGNAVCLPVGRFAVDSVDAASTSYDIEMFSCNDVSLPPDGYLSKGKVWKVFHDKKCVPCNIWSCLDESEDRLSNQASAGLCCRIIRTETIVPSMLFESLYGQAMVPTKLLGTKINSFEILHNEMDPNAYLQMLKKVEQDEKSQLELF
jgi:DNA (cytosine-5)-methyltransferase 1